MKTNIPQLAKKLGICKEWHSNMLKFGSWKNLCAMYFSGSDWSMEKDFPDEELARQIKEETAEYGILTDFEGSINLSKSIVEHQRAFLGNSKVTINATDFSASLIIMRHNSRLILNVSEFAYVIINVMDRAKVKINCEKEFRGVVSVYTYGENTTISAPESIIIKKAIK